MDFRFRLQGTPVAGTSSQPGVISIPNTISTSQGPATPTTGALQVAIQQATGSGQSYGAIKPGDAQTKLISAVNPGDNYPPTNTTLNYTNPK